MKPLLQVIAHRGSSALHPDNSWAAFEAALAEGADAIECDVQATRDGVLVIRHDLTIADRIVAEMSTAEIAAEAHGVPVLPDLLAWAERTRIDLLVEVKDPDAIASVAALIAASAWRDRIVVGSFHGPALAEVKAATPEVQTSFMMGSVVTPEELVRLAAACRVDGVHLCWESRAARPHRLLDRAAIDRLRRAGLAVTLWHEEREDELGALVALEPDAICTNTPSALRRIVDAHRASSPAQQGAITRTANAERSAEASQSVAGAGKLIFETSHSWRSTPTTRRTLMNWKLAFAATLAGALVATAQPTFAEDVVIKVWSRADRSGPLRAGNIVAAGDTLNKMLAAINSDKRVKIELNETNAKGYDDDALDLLKAFAVDKGPDIFVLAHEWTGAFAEAGYAQNLEDHIAKNPELYGDIIVPLWQSVTLQGRALRRAAGFRGAHVLPEQRQAAQARHERQGHRRAARQGGRGRVHRQRSLRSRRPGGPEGRGEIRHPASPERGTRLPDADGKPSAWSRTTSSRPSCRHRRRHCAASSRG